MHLNIKKKKNQNKGRRPTETFLQRRHAESQEAHEKILISASYWSNENQNYNEIITLPQSKWLNSTNSKCWRAYGEKGVLPHFWWECKLGQPLWRTVWSFLKKLKTEIPYDTAIPLLGIYLEKNMVQKDTCTPMFIAALFKIPKTWTSECPSTEKWINERWYIYTVEYYSAIKKNEIMHLQQHGRT